MNIRIAQSRESGSTLLLILVLAGILMASMASYLALTSSENKNVMRSLYWNAALPLAEAGIEEAMSHITFNTNSYAVDGWTKIGTNNIFTKQRPLGQDYYSVIITGQPNATIRITSTGAAHWVDTNYISRTVEITALTKSFPGMKGLVARDVVFGGNLTADSYDSSNPLYRNPALTGWYDPAKNSDLAFVGNPTAGLSLGGSTHLLGYAAAAPGFAVSVRGAAIVGSFAWANKGAEPGHATNGFTVTMQDPQPPFQSANLPPTSSVAGTNYTYVLTGGNYKINDLNSTAYGKTMYVSNYSVLYVTGNIDLSAIVFAGTNAHLDLYMAASSITFAPMVVGAAPSQFVVWGLPSCNSMDMSGGTSFVGLIYAPQTNLKATGGSQFYGAIMANSFKCTGTFDFHYDLASSKTIPPSAITIVSWDEL